MHWLTGSVGQADADELRILFATVPVLLVVAVLLQAAAAGARAGRRRGARSRGAYGAEPGRTARHRGGPDRPGGVGGRADRFRGSGRRTDRQPAAGSGHGRDPGRRAWSASALLLASDLVATQLLPVALPTGVVTGAVGAPYLLWLLITTNRQGGGG